MHTAMIVTKKHTKHRGKTCLEMPQSEENIKKLRRYE